MQGYTNRLPYNQIMGLENIISVFNKRLRCFGHSGKTESTWNAARMALPNYIRFLWKWLGWCMEKGSPIDRYCCEKKNLPISRKTVGCWTLLNTFALWLEFPDSNFHGAHVGPTWVPSAPDGSHVGPMNLALRVVIVPVDVIALLGVELSAGTVMFTMIIIKSVIWSRDTYNQPASLRHNLGSEYPEVH